VPRVIRMKAERLRQGLTQTALGERAGGIHISYISRIEAGHLRPSQQQLLQLCEALGISPMRALDEVELAVIEPYVERAAR
jgi:transcriptional regulator with XRE-family HTH domain